VLASPKPIVAEGTDTSNVSKQDIRKMFTNRLKKWPSGESVKLTMLKEGKIHEAFLRNYVRKTGRQYKTYWRRLVFSGRAQMPKQFETVEEMIEYVKNNKGAIGYVSEETPPEGCKFVKLD
jgi:ABC-type phosphate transport system substrate-binding protein